MPSKDEIQTKPPEKTISQKTVNFLKFQAFILKDVIAKHLI